MNDDLIHSTGHYGQSSVVQKVVSQPFLVWYHTVLPENIATCWDGC